MAASDETGLEPACRRILLAGLTGSSSPQGTLLFSPVTAEHSALLFRSAAPNAVFLIGGDSEVQAFHLDRAAFTDCFGLMNLHFGGARDAYRKEQACALRIGAKGFTSPINTRSRKRNEGSGSA
jgi:hypothetical protein